MNKNTDFFMLVTFSATQKSLEICIDAYYRKINNFCFLMIFFHTLPGLYQAYQN